MKKLTEEEITRIVEYLKVGKPLPEDYKNIIFDTRARDIAENLEDVLEKRGVWRRCMMLDEFDFS